MASRQEARDLRARWTQEALESADRAFSLMDPVAAYQGRPPPYPLISPFGDFEGRVDFRYLPLGATPKNRCIERVDLTGATDARNGQLFCSMIDCKIDCAVMETNLGEKIVRGTSFRNSKFLRTSLRGEFIDCDFSCSNLSHSLSSQTKFIRCNFSEAKMNGIGFEYCLFENCLWEGAKLKNAGLAFAKFVGTWPDEQQLASAMLPKAVFEKWTDKCRQD